MPNLKKLQAEELSLQTINSFFSAYQKLTIYQMQKNRDITINSREFSSGLVDAFIDVKQSLLSLWEKQKKKDTISFSTLKKNGKSVAVFLSFETKFSAAATQKAFAFFSAQLENQETDIVIAGLAGKKLFVETFGASTPFVFFELKEEETKLQKNVELVKHILNYERVDIYNPFYVSIINQEPQMSTISGDVPLEETATTDRKNRRFLFEPGKREILHFFEVQILASILQQKIQEAQLATLGSRVTTLQSTQQNLEEKLTKLQRLKLKTKRYKENKKQRNRLAGMHYWM